MAYGMVILVQHGRCRNKPALSVGDLTALQ